ncbi:MAG: ABC transporter permease [Actinobacteria bacterium]|nr:ABC transporter permease [Actinomycetota bacterium]
MSILAVQSASPEPVEMPTSSAGRAHRMGVGAWIALGILVFFMLVALLGPLLISTDPASISLMDSFGPPQPGHPLGFDGQGRDLLARLVYGARSSMLGPILVVLISTVLGGTIALSAAWIGGAYDAVVARVIDALFAFPGLLLAILAVSLVGPGLLAASIALSIGYTPYVARIIRSAALQERSLPYVSALTVQGLGGTSIVLRHILPNVSGIIVAAATLSYGYALIDLAALSFIGLGVQPPASDWGVMVADGVPGLLQGYPQESLYASACIVLVVGAVNFLGDRLTETAEGGR